MSLSTYPPFFPAAFEWISFFLREFMSYGIQLPFRPFPATRYTSPASGIVTANNG